MSKSKTHEGNVDVGTPDNNDGDGNERIQDFIRDVDDNLPVWESEFIIIKEIFKPLVEAIIEIIKQNNKARPTNLALIGNTNTGKTEFLVNFLPEFTNVLELSEGFGIVHIRLTTYTSLYGLYRAILDKLNWPYRRSDKISDLERLIGIACRERGVKIIVIDEFNQLDKRSITDQHRTEVLESLRNLPNHTLRPLLITGTQNIDALLEQEDQSDNRFDKIQFPRLKLTKSEGYIVRKLLANLEDNLLDDLQIKSDINSQVELIERIYDKSNGKIGSLVMTFEKAVSFAIKDNASLLTKTHLEKAIKHLKDNRRYKDSEDNFICEIEQEWYKVSSQ